MKKKSNDVPRETVLGPVLAKIKVGANAIKKSFGQGKNTRHYLVSPKTVDGGVVEMYVFGDIEPGKDVAALVEVKNKVVDGNTIHYVRAEIANGAKPKHRLFVGSTSDSSVKLDYEMPELNMKELGREFRIGFIKI